MQIKTVDEFRKMSCVAPYLHLSTLPTGGCQICCWFDNEQIADEAGNHFNFNLTPVKEIWDSKYYTKYRELFMTIDGTRNVSTCSKICMSNADNSSTKRHNLNRQFSDDDIQNIIDGRIPSFPALLEVKITNLCNLKGQTCGPENSTQFFTDYEVGNLYLAPIKKAFKIYLDTRGSMFLDSIVDNIDFVNCLEFYGGEPFMIKDHKPFLKRIVETGRAKQIDLRYITNGTIYDDDYSVLFKQFKKVIISVSMDSVFGKNEYIRMNSVWEDQIETILKFDAMLRAGELESLNLNTTISLLNLNDYTTFLEYFDDLFEPHPRLTLSVSLLHYPTDLKIAYMHPKQKNMWKFLKEKFLKRTLKTFDRKQIIDIFERIDADLETW
jgi:MoaA/NifB/PqqE/SkfB family radical SAM enzyme